jgi:D-3-phosphoglycerate dehydrogenase
VLVANCPGKNAIAVAELTFAMILALDRRIVDNAVDLRNGKWNKKEYSQAAGLKGRTLGIIGLGQIGEAVAERAKAFEMKIVAWSRSLTPERAEELDIVRADSPADVAARCDILTIHLAAAPETKKLVNADVLGRLKNGATVINTARADVVDYDALAKLAAEKKLRVGLDVFPNEPSASQGEFADAMIKAGGIIYGTHHIGASTEQAQMAIADETVRIVKDYLRTGRVHNCVNICAKSPAKYTLSVRHFNKPGVLAHTLNLVSHAGVNVEEMENIICEGLEAAVAQIKLDAALDDGVLRAIKEGNPHVIAVTQTQIA